MQHCKICGKLLSERKLRMTSEGLVCSNCAPLFFFCPIAKERIRRTDLKCGECGQFCPGHPSSKKHKQEA